MHITGRNKEKFPENTDGVKTICPDGNIIGRKRAAWVFFRGNT